MALITGTNLPDILLGTVANDTLRGLLADDILYGFDGHDLLQGGSGDDTLHGGSGNDRLDGGSGEDFFYGGSGIDTVTYLSAATGLVLDLSESSQSTGDAEGDLFTSIERFELSGFSDTFRGTGRGETVLAGGGNDTLSGFAGNDTLSGGIGNDHLIGGAGADRMDGGTGTDVASYETALAGVSLDFLSGVFTGEATGDTLIGIERLVLSAFSDAVTLNGVMRHVDAGAGRDTLIGTSADETLLGGSGRDSLTGNAGNDLLVAGTPALLLPGLDGDSLFGGIGNDTLQGGAGDAFLSGGSGRDRLLGEGANDTLIGGFGADVLNGGDGTDTVIYDTAVTIDLATPANSSGAAAGDGLTAIEVIEFTAGPSTYVGGSTDFTVRATGASVVARAGSGAETFHAMELVSYALAASSVTLSAMNDSRLNGAGAAAGDVLFETHALELSAQNDTLDVPEDTLTLLEANLLAGDDLAEVRGTELTATLTMGTGADTVSGFGASMTIDMGDGADQVTLISPVLNGFSAFVTGGEGHDSLSVTDFGLVTLEGGVGNDTLAATAPEGFGGSDVTLDGGIGDDSITGSTVTGALIMEGGVGNDTLTAEARFGRFEGDDGADTLNIHIVALESGFFVIDGGTGDDVLNLTQNAPSSVAGPRWVTVRGGTGNDDINGSDFASGVSGEIFEFQTGWGNDTISGFDQGTTLAGDDILFFNGVAGLDERSDLTVSGDATHVVFSFGGDSVRIDGIDAANAADLDIVFLI